MKVIGVVQDEVYICQLTHKEIEKFLNLYYNKMGKIKVGDDIDLGKGYDFHNDAINALKKTEEFIRGNKHIIEAITNGITVAANMESASYTNNHKGSMSDAK